VGVSLSESSGTRRGAPRRGCAGRCRSRRCGRGAAPRPAVALGPLVQQDRGGVRLLAARRARAPDAQLPAPEAKSAGSTSRSTISHVSRLRKNLVTLIVSVSSSRSYSAASGRAAPRSRRSARPARPHAHGEAAAQALVLVVLAVEAALTLDLGLQALQPSRRPPARRAARRRAHQLAAGSSHHLLHELEVGAHHAVVPGSAPARGATAPPRARAPSACSGCCRA
jgi:hypothetical protein